jgi:CheY-like chemotaxis protein
MSRKVTTKKGAQVPGKAEAQRNAKVVIFDDSVVTLDRYRALFSDHRVSLITVTIPVINPDLEVRLIRFDPDLIVVDLLMGESREDGYFLIQQIRSHHALLSVPIIVCSKLVNSSQIGVIEKGQIEAMLGKGTAYMKVPDLPSATDLLKHIPWWRADKSE